MTPEYVLRMDLAVEPDCYDVELERRTPVGFGTIATGKFPLPAADVARLQGLLTSNTPPGHWRGEGKVLYERLHSALGVEIANVLASYSEKHLYLQLPDGPLHKLPWELMEAPFPTPGGPVDSPVIKVHHLSRLSRPDWNVVAPLPDGPLRVLIAIGAPDDDAVQAEIEEKEIRRRIQPAHRTIDVETFVPASKAALFRKIKDFDPHVLHVIGHGEDSPPQLRFGGLPAERWYWGASDIVTDVGGFTLAPWKPRLVFLNTCRSGAAPGVVGTLASAFLVHATAVVAMQGDIKGNSAGALAGEFYGRLAQGHPISESLSHARLAILQGADPHQAAFAALTTRCAPSCTLPLFASFDTSCLARIRLCSVLPMLESFVNQEGPRRKLCGGFWPRQAGQPPRPFVLLRGDVGCGKSMLGTWTLDLAMRLGHHVRYVRLRELSGGVDCVRMLELLWNAETLGRSSPLTDPLPPLAPAVAARLRGLLDVEVFAAFREELRRVAITRPVTIVLDQLEHKIDKGGFWTLWQELFRPIALGELQNVNLVLALSLEDYAFYEIVDEIRNRPALAVPMNDIVLEGLGAAEFQKRFPEYAYFRGEYFRSDDGQDLIKQVLPRIVQGLPQANPIRVLEQKLSEVAKLVSFKLPPLVPEMS